MTLKSTPTPTPITYTLTGDFNDIPGRYESFDEAVETAARLLPGHPYGVKVLEIVNPADRVSGGRLLGTRVYRTLDRTQIGWLGGI